MFMILLIIYSTIYSNTLGLGHTPSKPTRPIGPHSILGSIFLVGKPLKRKKKPNQTPLFISNEVAMKQKWWWWWWHMRQWWSGWCPHHHPVFEKQEGKTTHSLWVESGKWRSVGSTENYFLFRKVENEKNHDCEMDFGIPGTFHPKLENSSSS